VTADHGLLSLPEIDFRSLRQSRGRQKAATQSLGKCCGGDDKSVPRTTRAGDMAANSGRHATLVWDTDQGIPRPRLPDDTTNPA